MLVAILTGLVVALWLDRMFFKGKDKVARKGLEALASEFNREVFLYDFIEEASIYTKDFSKEFKKDNKIFEAKMELHDRMNKICDRVEKIAATAEKTDKNIAQGVNTLARHLKLDIVPFKKEAEEGFKIEKIKKGKK